MLKVFKITKVVKDAYTRKTCVSISCEDLTLVITREQGARLTKNELACVVLRFLKDNQSLLEKALNYEFKHTNRAITVYSSDYGAVNYYVKYVTDSGYVYSKFIMHESTAGFVLDNDNKNIKVFLPDLIQLILDGALDFIDDKIVLDFANKLIAIINNEADIDVELYQLERSLPDGLANITDISERNEEELKKLQECEPVHCIKDLLK